MLQVTIANKNEKAIVNNLLQLYLHEQCPFTHQELNEEGQFGFPGFDQHFEEGEKTAFIFRLKGRIASFALLKTQEGNGGQQYRTISDIFLIETYRQWGVGEECARMIFDRYDGLWRIAIKDNNSGAVKFWKNVIWRYTNNNFKQQRYPDFEGVIFEFVTPPPSLEPQPMESLVDRPIVRRARTRFV